MSATSPLSTPVLRIDHLIHDAYREALAEERIDSPSAVRDDVRLDDSRPTASDDGGDVVEISHEAAEVVELAHGAHDLERLYATSGVAGAECSGAAITNTVAAPAALGGAMLTGAAHEFHQGRTFNAQVQYDRMKGILAALEGRTLDDPEVAAQARRSSGYRQGLLDAEHLSPETRQRIQGAIRESTEDAYTLVGLGEDRGRAFDRRYHSDLAFHHAVDYARRCKAENRPEWIPMRERAEALRDALVSGAHGAPIRG